MHIVQNTGFLILFFWACPLTRRFRAIVRGRYVRYFAIATVLRYMLRTGPSGHSSHRSRTLFLTIVLHIQNFSSVRSVYYII
ncbi:MAG: hypothetical protein ACK4KT_06420 [Thermaurantimonas sp.]